MEILIVFIFYLPTCQFRNEVREYKRIIRINIIVFNVKYWAVPFDRLSKYVKITDFTQLFLTPSALKIFIFNDFPINRLTPGLTSTLKDPKANRIILILYNLYTAMNDFFLLKSIGVGRLG